MSLSKCINSNQNFPLVKPLFPQVNSPYITTSVKILSVIKRHLCPVSDRKKASYSVEAAVVLPIFMGFVVCIMFFIRILMMSWAVDTAMTAAVDTMALTCDEPSLYAAEALFYEKLLTGDVKPDGIMGGAMGVSLLESSVDKKDITLSAVYRVSLPIRMFSREGILIHQKKSARIWNGYDPHEDEEEDVLVYVTPYGRAYHRSASCPYLNPSIRSVNIKRIRSQRNTSGHRYGACPLCKKEAGSMVYITSWGECYHGSIGCSGLKRTINRIELKEAQNKYHSCPKCGGE